MPSPKKKPALGKFLGAPVVGSRDQTPPRKTIENGKKQPEPVDSIKAPRAVEGGKVQTIYLRDGDLPKVWKAENALKVSRLVKGRIGLSLLLRVGLDMINDELDRNPNALFARAASIADAE